MFVPGVGEILGLCREGDGITPVVIDFYNSINKCLAARGNQAIPNPSIAVRETRRQHRFAFVSVLFNRANSFLRRGAMLINGELFRG